MATTFLTLYTNVCNLLKDNSTGNIARVKVAVNQAVKEICQLKDWTFMADIDNTIVGTGARSYSLSAFTDKDRLLMCRIVTQSSLGDTTSQYDIANPVGTTYRYTYDSNGTNPKIGIGYQQVNDLLTTTGFANAGNNITNIAITGVGTNYVEVTNAAGVVAANQTGVTFKTTEQDDATPIRRRNRLTVAQLTTWDSTGLTLSQPTRYCEPTTTNIQFDMALATTQAAFFDYKKLVTDLSADGDNTVVPDSWTYIAEQYAFAKMLRVDDDSRATQADQEAKSKMALMLKRCPYYDDLFDVDDTMEVGGYLDR